ncbi:amidohydrolase family protein [Nakamurella sp.]|uniref:amidohydrolase family protein n=1 Tax=Nakamurella sp. TaxID=1869182 RepID=UPI0037851724
MAVPEPAEPGGPPTVDVHAHAMPMPLLRSLADRGLADVSAVDAGIVRLDPVISGVGPGAPLPLARSQHDVATRLAEMDEAGVDVHAVSLPPFLFATNATDAAFAAQVVAQGNDELAAYVAAAPDRLVGLGYVPLGHAGVADEAVRVLDELGMAGIAIGSQGGGKDLDDPINEDLWALLAERNTFVFMHPSGMPAGPRLKDFWMPQLVGYPMETAIAVARLVFSGVLERHPFTLCLAHGGGCLPSLRGRMDMGWERKDVARTNDHPPSHYTRRLYYDTAVFDTTTLRRIVEDVGVEHVLMGTDHPFELGDPTPRVTVGDLGLSEAETAAILGGTAAGLLGLTVRR